jgi:hypothetical protein
MICSELYATLLCVQKTLNPKPAYPNRENRHIRCAVDTASEI